MTKVHCGAARAGWIVGVALSGTVAAQPLGVNLVVNGDAESGTIDGWVDGGIEPRDAASAGSLGLPPGVSTGDFCFTGAAGDPMETLSQEIDVSGRAGEIDAGEIIVTFAVLLQTRAVTGARDSAGARLEFRTGAGAVIDSVAFEDSGLPLDVFDWDAFEDIRTAPAGTRSVYVELVVARSAGASTDGFIDNVSLTLNTGCYADCDGSGGLDFFDFLCFQNAFATGDPYADCDGTGTLDFFDFLCFQNAFAAGCP
ncbi:MAG: hypothetical protein ACF8R7_07155 [Phycisphaerales bacterium JB039]